MLPALRTSAPLSVGGGVIVSAAATYVFLIVTARSIGAVDYAAFSVFWAVAVTVGIGLYLPVEQETARRGAALVGAGEGLGGLMHRSVLTAGMIAGVSSVGLVIAWSHLRHLFDDDPWYALALALASMAYIGQFPLRGLLSSTGQFSAYGAVLGVEGLIRLLLVVGAAIAGVRSPGWFASIVGVAAAVSVIAGVAASRDLRAAGPPVVARDYWSSVGRLLVGALLTQTLLNGGIVAAKILAAPGEAVLAGHLLAAITVTRIPVFLFQSVQASLLPTMAGHLHAGRSEALDRLLLRLAKAISAVGVVTVVGAALAGPWAVSLLYGSDFVVSRATVTVLGLGAVVFLVAVTTSDIVVALGGHTAVTIAWAAGAGAAGVVMALVPDLALRVTLPLAVGSAVVACSLGTVAWRRLQAARRFVR